MRYTKRISEVAAIRRALDTRVAPMPRPRCFAGGGFPPGTAWRGARPSQLAKCFSVGNADRSGPISVQIVRAAPVLMLLTPVAGQVLRELLGRMSAAHLPQRRQLFRVALPTHDRPHDRHSGLARHDTELKLLAPVLGAVA